MRILAFSDIHGEEAALEGLKSIAPDYDHVFICGDISRTEIFARAVLDAFPKAFLVPGNWDSSLTNGMYSSSPQYVHGKRVEIGEGLNVVGFGFSNPTPFGTYGELSEEEILAGISALPIDGNTLLLLHCPPKGHFDTTARAENAGSDSILKTVLEKKPRAVFFGHVHEHHGTKMLGKTLLIKLPAANGMMACSVELWDKDIKTEFIQL